MRLFTVGHSNHSFERFSSLLKRHGVTAIADVRSSPFSRHFSHFNQAPLKSLLKSQEISYVFLGDQLGARSKDSECYVDGKARYELIAATKTFATGLDRIFKGAKHHQIALMCAEQDPITCHRAILVCQYLRDSGLEIGHILKNGDLESHVHLEQRLLKLHNLGEINLSIENSTIMDNDKAQLSLFDMNIFGDDVVENYLPPDDLIKQAYQLQGDQIAYVEGYKNTGKKIYEQVS
jgi:uncharacterized protein (DUF488 family)